MKQGLVSVMELSKSIVVNCLCHLHDYFKLRQLVLTENLENDYFVHRIQGPVSQSPGITFIPGPISVIGDKCFLTEVNFC